MDALNGVCDIAQDQYQGFEWLTHFVNFDSFPDSLSIVCIYDTNENLSQSHTDDLLGLIKAKLAAVDININKIRKHVRFDTQENCEIEHKGKWNKRFNYLSK